MSCHVPARPSRIPTLPYLTGLPRIPARPAEQRIREEESEVVFTGSGSTSPTGILQLFRPQTQGYHFGASWEVALWPVSFEKQTEVPPEVIPEAGGNDDGRPSQHRQDSAWQALGGIMPGEKVGQIQNPGRLCSPTHPTLRRRLSQLPNRNSDSDPKE